ncbi:toll/interleukin-1 receptor domain-containing protein [Desulfitobacterium sp. AusDCA]|uniref:toll/interleukin-1 receptor domain-containing protein n=1 Tax=Desulfitobacterium sp. AusDCA TaxID=3240383 RepID=UPI003DA70E2A
MGVIARQFNQIYTDYKKKFKQPLHQTAQLMDIGFSDDDFVEKFKELYPQLWDDLNVQYKFWHKKNEFIIRHGKKSRYNFRKPYNFILDCSYHLRMKARKKYEGDILGNFQKDELEKQIKAKSQMVVENRRLKIEENLRFMQEINPKYADYFIDKYFKTHDLHEKLEIIRELSKYKTDKIIEFFYKVNAITRNHSLKIESMHYIQNLNLPFVLRRKKQGKKNFIDNEIILNKSNPDELLKRIYVTDLERVKEFDVFLSHSSQNKADILSLYKLLNHNGCVVYIDWINDKFDLRREWVNISTPQVLKKRLEQSKALIYYYSAEAQASQWTPWEIGLFDKIRGKICIYGLEDNENNYPEYLNLYSRLVVEENELIVIEDNTGIPFKHWMEK